MKTNLFNQRLFCTSLFVFIPFASNAQNADTTLDTITVTSKNNAYPITGYVSQSSATSTKINTPILKTSQTINTVGQPQLQAIGADSVMNGLQYTPGVSVGNNDGDIWESFYIRGFKSRRAFRDGMKYQVDAYDGEQEIYNVESIEVSKGPSSFAFAGDEPGGAINTISKRPTEEPLREVGIGLGNFGEKILMADFSDSLDKEGDLKYRLVGTYRNKDSHINHVDSSRFFLAPSISWQITPATNLTILAELQKDNAVPLESGIPRSAIFNNPNGAIDRTTFLGEPGLDKVTIKRSSIGYELKHSFNDNIALTHKARYFSTKPQITYTERYSLDADNRTLNRGRVRSQNRTSKQFTTDNFITADFALGNTTHSAVLGFDYITEKARVETTKTLTKNGNIDIFNPSYGQLSLDPSTAEFSGRTDKLTQWGIYAQNQIEVNNFTITLGGRYGAFKFGETPFGETDQSETKKAFTGRAGISYEFDNGVAPFVGFSQSFNHQSGREKSGKLVGPSRGQQVEVGVRYQPHENLLLSAVAYEINKTNQSERDPSDRSYRVVVGETSTKGFELEAQGKLTDDLSIIASYTKTKQRVEKSADASKIGHPIKDIPENQASLWADYKLTAFSLPNVKVGLGVRHVGETPYHGKDNVPGYTAVDAAINYQYKNMSVDLNIKNLTDKTYFSCAYECAYGEPRSFMATLKYRF